MLQEDDAFLRAHDEDKAREADAEIMARALWR
jgi:hypothetical protein